MVIHYRELILRAGLPTLEDTIIGAMGILLVIEAARRVVGIPMVCVVLFFIAYAFAGPYLPGLLAHRGLTINQFVSHVYYTTEGIFGIPLGVSSTFIFLFILFGAYLEGTGLGKFFIDLANAIAGWASGGPAKVAVLSSGLMGTVSGSSVANVVGTGSLTIPMMKKLGYHKDFAGAVEAAASTGGQLMPPVMGAAAFLMAEFVGVAYVEIVKAAVIPAFLYFMGVWLGVHFEAQRNNLKGIPREELPKVGEILRERGHLAIPLIVIVYLLVSGYTPMRAALVAIVLSILVSAIKKSTRMKSAEIIKGLENGARNVLGVLVACAAAGIIIGVVTKTGVGLKLASGLLQLSGGMLLPSMFFTMVTAIILGMGVPTTANYVITSTIAAPALLQMGVPILAAHMFVFYFGIIADVTPPVALAAYAGAGISGGNALSQCVEIGDSGVHNSIYVRAESRIIISRRRDGRLDFVAVHGAYRNGGVKFVADRIFGRADEFFAKINFGRGRIDDDKTWLSNRYCGRSDFCGDFDFATQAALISFFNSLSVRSQTFCIRQSDNIVSNIQQICASVGD